MCRRSGAFGVALLVWGSHHHHFRTPGFPGSQRLSAAATGRWSPWGYLTRYDLVFVASIVLLVAILGLSSFQESRKRRRNSLTAYLLRGALSSSFGRCSADP
jgi:hypothetical protein